MVWLLAMDLPVDNDGDNQCPHCSRTFVLHGNLRQHLLGNHLEEMDGGTSATGAQLTPLPVAHHPSRGTHGTPASALRSALPNRHMDRQNADGGSSHPSQTSAEPTLGTTAEKVRAYYTSFGDMGRTRPLVSSTSVRPSNFDTDELKQMRLFALSAGGKGLSQKARAEFYNSAVNAERAALRSQRGAEAEAFGKILQQLGCEDGVPSVGNAPRREKDQAVQQSSSRATPVPGVELPASGHESGSTPSTSSPSKQKTTRHAGMSTGAHPSRSARKISLRTRIKEAVLTAQAELEAMAGPLETAFPTEAAFLNSLNGETARCSSEKAWRMTDIVDGDDIYTIYSRDVMRVALNAFMRSAKRCMRGRRHLAADGSIRRTGSLDSDLYLREQADVDKIHGGRFHNGKPLKVFTMATQFFSDATLVSKNGGTSVEPCSEVFPVLECLGWVDVARGNWLR